MDYFIQSKLTETDPGFSPWKVAAAVLIPVFMVMGYTSAVQGQEVNKGLEAPDNGFCYTWESTLPNYPEGVEYGEFPQEDISDLITMMDDAYDVGVGRLNGIAESVVITKMEGNPVRQIIFYDSENCLLEDIRAVNTPEFFQWFDSVVPWIKITTGEDV